MKGAHLTGQMVDVRRLELARLDATTQQCVLGELRHFHGVLNGGTLGAKRGRSGVP